MFPSIGFGMQLAKSLVQSTTTSLYNLIDAVPIVSKFEFADMQDQDVYEPLLVVTSAYFKTRNEVEYPAPEA